MVSIEADIAGYITENILFSGTDYPYPLGASFLENGIIDSMNVLELVMFIEEKYNIKVSDNDIIPDNFDSVERLANFVSSRR